MNSPAAKRFFDLSAVLFTLPIWLPLVLLLAVIVRWKMGAPVLYKQERPGYRGRIFKLWKFRTMTDAKDGQGRLLSDVERLTAFGKWLRAASLDEAPEILNVLWGEMSLVGPRPLLVRYLDRYTPEQARRHEVRPGITGWAQVKGRNSISWEEKLRLDVWYVDNQSLWLDLKILALTIVKVLSRQGISAPGDATMPEFVGSSVQNGKEERAESQAAATFRAKG